MAGFDFCNKRNSDQPQVQLHLSHILLAFPLCGARGPTSTSFHDFFSILSKNVLQKQQHKDYRFRRKISTIQTTTDFIVIKNSMTFELTIKAVAYLNVQHVFYKIIEFCINGYYKTW